MTAPPFTPLGRRVRGYLEARPEGRCDRCVAAALALSGENAITRVNQCARRFVVRAGAQRRRAFCPGCGRPRVVTTPPD